jgi:hypothetical protein
MRYLGLFAFFFGVALLALFLAIVLGDSAPWYFAWVVGTAMIVLIAAAGGMLFDTEEAADRGGSGKPGG